jgi:GNAT superfamily N-acetyltransferase
MSARSLGDGFELDDDRDRVDLADVYVLSEYRWRGLGDKLVREMIAGGPTQTANGCCTPATPTRSIASSASTRRTSG